MLYLSATRLATACGTVPDKPGSTVPGEVMSLLRTVN